MKAFGSTRILKQNLNTGEEQRVIKSDLAILERVFAQEIFGQIYQSKAKRLEWLRDNGYVEFVSFVIPGRFPIKVEGWALTHLGRMTYCETCRDVPEPEGDE